MEEINLYFLWRQPHQAANGKEKKRTLDKPPRKNERPGALLLAGGYK